jgi:hypothetical protein
MRVSFVVRVAGVMVAVAVALSVAASSAWAGTANAGIKGAPRSNPIAGLAGKP